MHGTAKEANTETHNPARVNKQANAQSAPLLLLSRSLVPRHGTESGNNVLNVRHLVRVLAQPQAERLHQAHRIADLDIRIEGNTGHRMNNDTAT